MWQRVQTLYLLLASLLFGSLFFCNLANVIGAGSTSDSIAFIDKTPYLVMMIIIELIQVFDLISFKVRPLQQRLTVLVALLMLGFQIWLAVDYFTAPDGVIFKFTAIFPVICIILDAMALRGIISDILVAGSVNRLRATRRKERKNRK